MTQIRISVLDSHLNLGVFAADCPEVGVMFRNSKNNIVITRSTSLGSMQTWEYEWPGQSDELLPAQLVVPSLDSSARMLQAVDKHSYP